MAKRSDSQRKTNKRYCCASNCLNSNRTIPDLSLFSLPKDPEKRLKWLTLIGREDMIDKENFSSYEVCAVHFDESVFKIVKYLKSDALPTKFLSNDVPQSSSSSQPKSTDNKEETSMLTEKTTKRPDIESTETSIKLAETSEAATQTKIAQPEQSPQKRKLLKDLTDSECKRTKLEYEFHKLKNEFLSKNTPITSDPEDEVTRRFKKLIAWLNKIRNKNKSNRYDAEYKFIALNFYYSNPVTYRCLQTVLKLPNKGILKRFKLKIPPELDNQVFESLSMKIKSLPEKAKHCSICVDKMDLKRNLYYNTKTDEVIGFHNIDGKISPAIASNAYVIMLQGIFFDWKQPIAYAFLASTKQFLKLDTWIHKVIVKLFGINIEVKAFISDQDTFDQYAKMKKVSVYEPYFLVNEHKIYYIFDIPHLLKSLRNNLLSSNFYYEGQVISWDYIRILYEDQKHKKLRLIPKITEAHVEPKTFQKLKVKYAAQIFSNTVHAALETYIDFGKITEDARATSKFIKTIDSLFDVLNSSKFESNKKLQSAFSLSNEQKTVLAEAQKMFANIKSYNQKTGKENTNQIKTFQNFQISIEAIHDLFKDLKEDGFGCLFTRRLNQDNLENFFESLREQDGCCTEPTPIRFIRAFSKLFLLNMLKNPPFTNYELDLDKVLRKAEDFTETKITIPDKEVKPSLVSLDGESDYRMDLPKVNAVIYVASYLIFKSKEIHICDEMISVLKSMPGLIHSNLFAKCKAYNNTASFYECLKLPPHDFIQYVEKLETAFVDNFEKCIQDRPGSTMFQLLNGIPFVKICSCFPSEYVLKLFIRLRIFATLRSNNRSFKTSNKYVKENLKVQQL